MANTFKPRGALDRATAETIAAQALAFLAADRSRLVRFLSLTGLEPGDVRARAGSTEVLAAVLAHLTEDESLLLVFAGECGIAPEALAPALACLQGHRHE